MSIRVGRAYFVVPVVYVAVIFGLLVLQFSGGERITRSVEQLVLQAARSAVTADGTPSMSAVSLDFNGVSFAFSDETGLTVTRGATSAVAAVQGFQSRDDGFDVEFTDGIVLEFLSGSDPVRELRIRLVVPPEVNADRFSVPFTLMSGASSGTTTSATFVSVVSGADEFYLTAPPRASIDLVGQRIVIDRAAVGETIRYVEATTANPAQITAWFEDSAVQITDAAYRDTIAGFIDTAYTGWATGRLNAATLTWSGPGASAAFSERALAAYLSEAWTRGDYDRAFAEMRRARDLHGGSLGLLSAAFLGDLERIYARARANDRTRAEALASRIADGDFSIYSEPDTLTFAAHRGSEELYTAALLMAETVDPGALDVTVAVGMLANLTHTRTGDDRLTRLASRLSGPLADRVIGSIARLDDGYFLQTAPGQIDVASTILAGVSLIRHGQAVRAELPATIGRNLVTSALALSDRFGLLPAALVVRGESYERSAGRIGPESIYPLIAENPAYPREHSLYAELGSGNWIWSVMPIEVVGITPGQWRFAIEYPRLRTHYIIHSGVPVFDRMELFGLVWRNAPDFEIYSKGRHYDPESGTLFIKYYDDSVRREIALVF